MEVAALRTFECRSDFGGRGRGEGREPWFVKGAQAKGLPGVAGGVISVSDYRFIVLSDCLIFRSFVALRL